MRHVDIIVPQKWFITEAKARIDHPEDLIFDDGASGAKRALSAMVHAAEEPKTVSIKWDGSPALIFGRDHLNGLVLTDKSGFNATKPESMPRSAEAVKQMLFMRKPTEPGREAYANSIANLYHLLDYVVPDDYKGYLQGDLLWTTKPQLLNGEYVFKPNKIQYSIPADSLLGKKIANSAAGIVIHSEFNNGSNSESHAMNDINELGLKDIADLVLMSPNIHDLEIVHIPNNLKNSISLFIDKFSADIDEFLNFEKLKSAKISDMGSKMKQFLAYRASHGLHNVSNAPHDFITWINSIDSKLTDNKRANILDWINQHYHGYIAVWKVVEQLIKLKNYIRDNIDKQINTSIGAVLNGQQGHEGYVADTPNGKIKLVNRPHFMRKEQPL